MEASEKASCSFCNQPCKWVFGHRDSFVWACGEHLEDALAAFDAGEVSVYDVRDDA